MNNEESGEFKVMIELGQGCTLCPLLFSVELDKRIKKAKSETKKLVLGYWKLEKVQLTELAFADDMLIVSDSEEISSNLLEEELEKFNVLINATKLNEGNNE